MPITKKYLFKEVAGTGMLIPIDSTGLNMSKVIDVNEVGCFIYKRLEKNMTRDEIVDDIIKEYNVSRDTVGIDVDNFIKKLKDKGIYSD